MFRSVLRLCVSAEQKEFGVRHRVRRQALEAQQGVSSWNSTESSACDDLIQRVQPLNSPLKYFKTEDAAQKFAKEEYGFVVKPPQLPSWKQFALELQSLRMEWKVNECVSGPERPAQHWTIWTRDPPPQDCNMDAPTNTPTDASSSSFNTFTKEEDEEAVTIHMPFVQRLSIMGEMKPGKVPLSAIMRHLLSLLDSFPSLVSNKFPLNRTASFSVNQAPTVSLPIEFVLGSSHCETLLLQRSGFIIEPSPSMPQEYFDTQYRAIGQQLTLTRSTPTTAVIVRDVSIQTFGCMWLDAVTAFQTRVDTAAGKANYLRVPKDQVSKLLFFYSLMRKELCMTDVPPLMLEMLYPQRTW